jgi:phosphoribosyl-ATP pyrophosphohydrolase
MSAQQKTFELLWDELQEKVHNPEDHADSRTVKEFQAGAHAIGKKIVEEAAEVWMAAEFEGNERCAEEISQLLYHLQVLMLERGISLEEVYAKL